MNSLADTSDSSLPFGTCLLLFLHTFLKCLVSLHLVQSFPIAVHLHGSCTVLHYLYFCLDLYLCHCGLLMSLPLWFAFSTISHSLLSLVMLSIVFAPSALLPSWPNSTSVHLLFCYFFIVVNSFMISVIITSSMSPLMNCSFSPSVCLFAFTCLCHKCQVTHPFLGTFLFLSYQLASLKQKYFLIMLRFELVILHLLYP